MQVGKNSVAIGYAAPAPKPRFLSALDTIVLVSITSILIYMAEKELRAIPVSGPRALDYPTSALAYVLLALLPVSLLLWMGYCVWRNRRGFRAWGWGRRILSGLRIVLQPIGWFLFLLVLWGVLLMPPLRVFDTLVETVGATDDLCVAVAERAEASGTLTGAGTGLDVTPGNRITAGLIGRDGAVLAYNGQVRMLAVLLPSMKAKRVGWSCEGMPPKYFWPFRFCSDATGATSFALRTSGSPREDALALLARAVVWQRQVESSALAHGTLDGSASTTIVRRQGLTDFALLDSNGRMALYSDRHGTFALLEPTLEKGKVTWHCHIWPATAATAACAPGR